ncbi:hypothetical protein CQR55_1067 [Bifidobacterium pseudolongum subsp. globosum]|uniref:hypothetical protein n=1 Tax=Bifidobacterium pseudolongum TaxID=1694 RepID=UPI000C70FAE4|nr:hypothetical protein [Bifidobacterium pseudolongum]PKU96732.1 hypothetical protein CQR55_1067 [Bifidobacterium pseudolongum subsp. globosum]
MSTQHDNADTTRCAACVEARERLDDASAERARAWLRYRDASEAYFNDTASGALSLGSSECTQRWSEVNRLWHESQAHYSEWIAVQHEGAHTISEHSRHLQEAAGEVQDVPLAETEERHAFATDTASAHDDLDGDVEEPLYLCGGFLNAQAERHATVERHEIEEDDVLRDAVRAIEHGETTQIRAWGFGNRQGRRTVLRELRELLDNMIADIDADNQQSQQTPAAGTSPQEPAETGEMGIVATDAIGSEEPSVAEELWYGDVPDFDLPDDFEDGSWVSLHSASVAVRAYMILLERYAPRAAKGYPAWVANRLRDVLDEAAIQRAIADQGGRK